MDILKYPNPTLKQTCVEVDPTADSNLEELAREMVAVMYDEGGVGLAASQIGVLKQVVVMDLNKEKPSPFVICNPCIIESGEETEIVDEGCLSFPGMDVPVERAVKVKVTGMALNGRKVVLEAEGLMARCFQHEIDHLHGITILDRTTPEARSAALTKHRESLLKPSGE